MNTEFSEAIPVSLGTVNDVIKGYRCDFGEKPDPKKFSTGYAQIGYMDSFENI